MHCGQWRGILFVLAAWATSLAGPTSSYAEQPVEVPHLTELRGHRGRVTYMNFSEDDNLIITTEDDHTVRIWNLHTGAVQRTIEQEHVGNTIKIWDIQSGRSRHLIKEEPTSPAKVSTFLRRIRGQKSPLYEPPITSLHIGAAFLSNNRRIGIAITDPLQQSICPGELLIYDLDSCKLDTIYSTGVDAETPHARVLDGWAWPRQGSLVVYHVTTQKPSLTSEFFVHDLSRNRVLARICAEDLSFAGSALSPSEELLVTISKSHLFTRKKGERSGRVDVWNARTGERVGRVQTDGWALGGLLFSPNGRDLASIGGIESNRIIIFYLNSFKIRCVMKGPGQPGQRPVPFCSLAYTPDGKYLAASRADGTVVFWDTREYKEALWARLFASGGLGIVPSRDGKKLCAVGEQNVIKIWDLDRMALSPIPLK